MPLEALAADVRYAWRSWWAAPAVIAVAVLSLALGIGANTAIFSVIINDAGWLIVCGLAIGVPLSRSVTRLAASLLYGVTPGDPAALAWAAALLAAAAMAAAFLPARRAARLNPIAALRED